jgi:outer membrane protein TolC
VARAKANRGLSAQFNARFGMSGSADTFNDTFIQLRDQEVIGVQLNIPILDWGQGRGRVRMAEAQAQTTRNSLEQNMIDFRQDIYTQVMTFNDQRSQCEIAKRAAELADESYELALRNFGSGSMTMTQLDQLKDKRDSAISSYLGKVAGFWSSYYGIRKATLYDYITGTDISAEFDRLISK